MKLTPSHIYCLLVCALMVSGCQTTSPQHKAYIDQTGAKKAYVQHTPVPGVKPRRSSLALNSILPPSDDYYAIAEQKQCVPHAREVSGIPIRGNAYTWWGQAEGKYVRNDMPQPGAVMVLSKTDRLKFGHLAVVKNVIDTRTVEVEHTNWGGDLKSRCIVYKRMPVKDISPNNDWSVARFFNYPSQTFGSAYKVSGFIHPVAPTAPHDKLALSTQ